MVVNAGLDSMGGVIDGGVEISSAPSPQQSSDLEKTQAELRETFSAAEKFRRELEFLQKGGDPLDLKLGNAASVSLQSTSLLDPHPEQFVTSEVKGSFAITASTNGDSVESSGRLGAPSVGEPNSADNLMLFDGDNKFREVEKRSLQPRMNNTNLSDVALEFPKKSYKRRNRSRPNRDGARSSSTDAGPRSGQPFLTSRHASRDTKGLEHDADNQENKYLSTSNSKPKSPLAHKNLAFNSRLDVKLNSNQTQKSTLGPAYGPFDQPLTSDTRETLPSMCSAEMETLSGSAHPPNIDTQTVTKGFESKSSCSQANQSVDGVKENELLAITRNVNSNGTMELKLALKSAPSMEGNDVNTIKDERIFNLANDNCNPCPASHNDNGSTLKEEEGLKGSESETVCSRNNLKMATKEHEDLILEEARFIEEKRKTIAGLSIGILSSESHHRSHWHFVLEEMSWLANDFAQERLWKANIAAQISRRAAYKSRVRFQQQISLWKQKEVAHALAAAVMEFWHTLQVKCNGLELTGSEKDTKLGFHEYGIRFLEYNNSCAQYSSAQAPMTPDRISDLGITDTSWEDNLTEENLFYTVPPGAIEAYRKSIESHLLQRERTGSSMQEEVDASGYDAVTDDALEEDEGETSTYYLPGAFEGSRSSKPAQKRTTHFRSYGPRPYETGPDLSTVERNFETQPSVSGKRPNTNINVSIPTKRVRTASRPRFIGTAGFISRAAGASSGDTNPFQDEQSSLNGGSHIPNNMEVESAGDYEKQLHFDLAEVSHRPKKKKKIKHPGSMFDHRWQLDSNFHSDQKDHSKRRLDARQFDSNGNSVASETSNMSNPNKFMKLLVRDRGGRKASKSLKTPAVQQGSGSPWSLFEDQALVVLVHDMGANWELISDAINSTLQFKCISRNSKECKERHKYLMDRNTGDGADSAEDSGSSQPYPSTLPGIPEGSARQLFQRLQGPMEENTLKSHFEKIIMIWQKQHYRKAQKDNQDPKQLQQPHGSHALALSQVCPNNLNGGAVLTPLDLCDAISPSLDFVPVGYHAGGLPIQNHGNVAAMVPPASSLPGSSSTMGLGSHLASASAPHSPSVRDARYGIPRAGSLSIIDEQQQQHRIQQLNQMSAARNTQQSGTDRLFPGGNGINRRSVSRPAFHSAPGQGNMLRPRDALHLTRPPNQNSEHLQRQIVAPDLQVVSQGGMASFPNPNTQQQPILQSFPHPHPHLQGPSNHHPPYGVRFGKERQLHQQRLLQQQFPTSNSVMPHGQPPQLPVSSTSSTQIQSHSSSPLSLSPMAQKRPVPPPPPHRLPQTGVNQPPHQFQQTARQHPTQQLPKVIKGGGGRGTINQNIATDSSLVNGFVGGPSGAASKQSMPHSSLNQSQQKRYPSQPLAASSSKQIQPQKPSHLSDTNSNNHAPYSSNHRQPQPPQKLVNQTQATPAQRVIHNRKEPPTSKLQAREAAQTSEPFYDSSGAAEIPTGGSEDSGPVVNHGGGVHKQSSSDMLPKSVGHGDAAGVQWQQQPSS